MRKVLLIFIVGVATAALADTIVLKNGRRIVCDSATEKGDKIIYEIGDDEYAIPKSTVDHVETGAGPLQTVAKDAPTVRPLDVPKYDTAIEGELIRNGHIDESVLDANEKQGPERATQAYMVAAHYEQVFGDPERATRYLERALSFSPDSVAIMNQYGASLIQVQRLKEAVEVEERATRADPASADAYMLLGVAQYRQDKLQEAISAMQRSLDLRPNKALGELLEKAERELKAESEFGEQESGHFTLRYEGGQSSPALRAQILSTLESGYDDLVRDLGAEPKESIAVILYTRQAYFDVTRAPSWAGALYDGRLRIPVQGLDAMTPELNRVLRHELTHSFVRQITHNRCPGWLNEGLAQLEEPRSYDRYRPQLAALYAAKKQMPLYALSGSFTGMNDQQAELAYLESLGAVSYIRDTYGMSDLERILERIGDGEGPETALRDTIHAGYDGIEDDLAQYYAK